MASAAPRSSPSQRIPEIDEIVDAELFANRLIERAAALAPLIDDGAAEAVADGIVAGGEQFCRNLLDGLEGAGIDTRNPFELLLAIRRIGAKRLEELFGPGEPRDGVPRGREPVVRASVMDEIESAGRGHLDGLEESMREAIRGAGLTASPTVSFCATISSPQPPCRPHANLGSDGPRARTVPKTPGLALGADPRIARPFRAS